MLVLVFVAAGEATDATGTAMLTAARQALGTSARLVIDEGADRSDDDALLYGDMLQADAVVEVSWDAKKQRASIHLHLTGKSEWRDRELRFVPADVEVERGRATGFAIAAMIPDPAAAIVPVPTDPTPPEAPVPSVVVEKPKDRIPPVRRPTVPFHREPAFAIEGALTATSGLGGPAGGYGGEVGARFGLHAPSSAAAPAWSLRLAAGARVGEVAEIRATATTVDLAAGLALRFLTIGDKVGVGMRGELVAVHQGVSRPVVGDAPEHRGRWLPAGQLLIETTFALGDTVALTGAFGGQVTFGATDLVVEGRNVAAVPWLRILGSAGFLARF